MRKISVVTGTRAEYGILYHIIKRIHEDDDLELQLIVTGTHLVKDYGYTIENIISDGFPISERIDILFASNSALNTAKSVGLAVMEFAAAYERLRPDLLLILGDRYESFAAASAALLMNIPIAHISGGEITEGAQDEQIRHSITKMAHLHFTGSDKYSENVRKMGEEDWRVFNVGEPGIENIKRTDFLSGKDIKDEFGIIVDRQTLLVTFHPVTLELDRLESQIKNLCNALNKVNKKIIITYPNADSGGKLIINEFINLANTSDNIYLVKNLGTQKYLSIMKLCGAVVGNSSSAIIEAPFLKIPVVNIGNRQKGRMMAINIINCSYAEEEIINSINLALSSNFRALCDNTVSLYGEGNTSEEIVKVLKNIELGEKLLKKKLVWS